MLTVVIVAIILVALILVGLIALRPRLASSRLRKTFGPEYDRVLAAHHGEARPAERELESRSQLVKGLDLKPVSPAARERYLAHWAAAQERFVDAPGEALIHTDSLFVDLLNERGYPLEGQLDALSVQHPQSVQGYREALAVTERARVGTVSTEELREAMIRIREIFYEQLQSTTGPQAQADPKQDVRTVRPAPAGTAAADSGPARPDAGQPAAAGTVPRQGSESRPSKNL